MNSYKETKIFIALLEAKTGLDHEAATKLYINSGYNYPKALQSFERQKEEDRLMGLYLIHLEMFEGSGCDIDFETFKRTL